VIIKRQKYSMSACSALVDDRKDKNNTPSSPIFDFGGIKILDSKLKGHCLNDLYFDAGSVLVSPFNYW
jgi:hypothetical protein